MSLAFVGGRAKAYATGPVTSVWFAVRYDCKISSSYWIVPGTYTEE